MNRTYHILLLILIFIAGCKNTDTNIKKINQVIDNFDMNIYSIEGNKLFSIKSPYSYYDKENNSIVLENTTINLFKNSKIEYIINSDNSKLSDNNKLVELNGNVQVKTLSLNSDKLYANSFKWHIQDSEYLLVGNVKFENETITLTSNKAILNKSNNIIEFFNPVNYKIKDSNKRGYEINSENAYYNIDTKSVSFSSKDKKVRSKIYF